MNTITATKARNNLFGVLHSAIKSYIPTRIKTKEGSAIVLSEKDYESILETAKLTSIPGFVNSIKVADEQIKTGEYKSLDEVFEA